MGKLSWPRSLAVRGVRRAAVDEAVGAGVKAAVGALLLVGAIIVWSPSAEAQSSRPAGEWHATGGDHTNTKYSPLDQITPDNFTDLEIAWRWASISTDVTEQNSSLVNALALSIPYFLHFLV